MKNIMKEKSTKKEYAAMKERKEVLDYGMTFPDV